MKRKNIIKYIVLPVLVVLAAAAFYIYKEYNRTHKDTTKLRPDYSVTAVDLIKEFELNENSSGKKYWDKVMRVEGVLKEKIKDEKGYYTLALGDTVSMSSVRCTIDSVHSNEAAVVTPGHIITVKGICTGFKADELLGSDVILVRSIVEKKND